MESAEQLDADISNLHARIATLKAHRANLSSVLLAQPHLATRLGNDATSKRVINQQSKRNLENAYRACAGVTAYKVKDPDPHAAHNGDILGISIEIPINGGFTDTYHVLLSVEDSKRLRIHRHTIPSCVPLQQLANKWLPQGTRDVNSARDAEQDVVSFGRALRRELVSWHMRLQTVRNLRKEARLRDADADADAEDDENGFISGGKVLNAFVSDDSSDAEPDDGDDPARIMEIEADAAVRQVTVTWSDGHTAILLVTKDGRVERAICKGRGGRRDGVSSTKAVGPLSGLLRRLS